jgi:hypothetical protein
MTNDQNGTVEDAPAAMACAFTSPSGYCAGHARGLAYIRFLAFLAGFAGLLVFVSYYYLFPAMEAAGSATAPQRKVLAAHSRLILAIVLFIVLVGLILTFRVGRFFQPSRRQPRAKPTVYPDAWAEAGRRVKIDPEDK